MIRALLCVVVILVVCVGLYWPALRGPFLFDDFPNLSALASITRVDSWRDIGIYLSQPRSFPGRPVAMLSFLLQKSAWPDHPFPFKLINLLIHLFNGLLVYRLTLVLARCRARNLGTEQGHASRAWLAALLACAAWLLMPIQSSAILQVVQRMTLLMASFVLLGLLAWLKGLLDDSVSDLRRGLWMALGLGLCMGLAFLSKENGILLPLYALVLGATVLRPQVRALPAGLRRWQQLLIWPVVLFVFGYLLYRIPQSIGADFSSRAFSFGEHLLTEPRILFDYLGRMILPRFGVYGLFHDGYQISRGLLTPWTTLLALAGLVAMVVTALVTRKRWPLLALAVLWFLGGQVIESSTIMLELYFEHRNYVPIIGACMALGMALATIREPARRKLALVGFGAWLLASTFALGLTAQVYSSADRLAVSWANQQPQSVRAQVMLAGRYFAHGQLEESLDLIQTALHRHPDNAGLIENRLYLKCMQGSLTRRSMQRAVNKLRSSPFSRLGFNSTETLRKLANTDRCPGLNPKSWNQLVHALLDNPAFRGDIALGFLHYQLHKQAVTSGDLAKAIHELDIAFQHDPNSEIPRMQAKYLMSAGLYDQAIQRLKHYPYQKLPLLRRLLVDDHAINKGAIAAIRDEQRRAGQ